MALDIIIGGVPASMIFSFFIISKKGGMILNRLIQRVEIAMHVCGSLDPKHAVSLCQLNNR